MSPREIGSGGPAPVSRPTCGPPERSPSAAPWGLPAVQADLHVESLEMPQVGAGAAHVRVSYDAGEFDVEEFTFESPQGRGQVRGGYTKARGLNLTITEAKTDFSVFSPWLQPLGLNLSGPATLKASVQGQPSNPNLDFEITAPRVVINGIETTGLTVAGQVRDHVLSFRQAEFRQDGGKVSLSGSYDLRTTQMKLRLTAASMDLALVSFWLRPMVGLAVEGIANGEITAAGTLLNPQVHFAVSSPALLVNQVAFREVTFVGRIQGQAFTIEQAQFSQGEGKFTLGGTIDMVTRQMNLTCALQHVDIYNATLVFARAAARLRYFGTSSQLLNLYTSIRGHSRGFWRRRRRSPGPMRIPKGRCTSYSTT